MKRCSSVVMTVVGLFLSGLLCFGQQGPAVDLQVGDRAPDFALPASDGSVYSLAQFLGAKAVVLCWFPRAGSQGAKIQCASLEAVMGKVPTDKVQVFGCSTAPLDVTVQFAQQGQYSFPILSDADHSVARAFGCLRPDGLSQRWTFLIDETGAIVAINKTTSPQTQGADLLQMLADHGFIAPPTAPPVATGDQQITLQVGELTRTCLLHLPPAYDGATSLPAVIAFHGARGNGQGMARGTGLSALADQVGFILACPDGMAGDRTWNALFGTIPGGEGILADDVDDVAFTRALIELLRNSYHADPARIFVCGYSAGAYMAYRAAVELSDLIAAAGPVNGSLGIKSLNGQPCGATIPPPAAPISLIHICGAQDGVVKFGGGQAPKNLFKSVPDCIQFFVAADGCQQEGIVTRDDEHAVTRTLYTGGRAGTEVELVVVDNCNHSWPIAQYGLSATQELWDFFSSHPKQVDEGAGGADG